MEHVLETLIHASERAAEVARSCVTGSNDGALLVAEKAAGEANARFDKDFKTIADVLAQESAKCAIRSRFPELSDRVRGEECAEIDGVRISIKDNIDQTAELLRSLVPSKAAWRMAKAAHTYYPRERSLPKNLPSIDIADLGVWIDPIDATAQFIAGARGKSTAGEGLPCVTVLVGAYLIATGEPIIGVVNQPFLRNGKGRIFWGISYEDVEIFSDDDLLEEAKCNEKETILFSAAEDPEIVKRFKNAGWYVKTMPGAGHKLLKVALGEAAAYLVTKGTTFRWDTCAPHSLIKANGGDIVTYRTKDSIKYNIPDNAESFEFANPEGIIAYRDEYILQKIVEVINSN